MVAMARKTVGRIMFLAVSATLASGACLAGPQSLLGGGMFKRSDSALIDRSTATTAMIPAPQNASLTTSGGSLFSGRNTGSLFAARPDRAPVLGPLTDFGVAGLRQLIASAEAGKADYDAVQHGAIIKPPKPPTRMTLREIYDWIDATPGQPHAIGRYQMIPPTLRRVVRDLGLDLDERFTPRVQDLCADVLLEEAGLSTFLRGELGQKAFMNNLAKIWAGLPNATGRSHYHGYAGNRAVMTWAQFETGMARIFPRG